jgi:serine/threonine protein kinase
MPGGLIFSGPRVPLETCNRAYVMLLQEDGRIALVMQRAWRDLRQLIDLKKQANHNQGPPFHLKTTLNLIWEIAFQMMMLHDDDVVHRDLKASNVLLHIHDPFTIESALVVWKFLVADIELTVPSVSPPLVSDYEYALGVLGTGFWRASEALLGIRDPSRTRSPTLFTKKSDVYSYGMVCYEIVIEFLPFE